MKSCESSLNKTVKITWKIHRNNRIKSKSEYFKDFLFEEKMTEIDQTEISILGV